MSAPRRGPDKAAGGTTMSVRWLSSISMPRRSAVTFEDATIVIAAVSTAAGFVKVFERALSQEIMGSER